MNESLLNRILKDHKRRTRSLALILCLSMIVSLGTFAGFHKTAQAKVYTKEVLNCPYTNEGAEPVAHVHNDDCYEGETLVCTLPEREAHTHTDECFTEQRVLVCGLEENPGHQHSEACYDENGELICQIPEGEGAHAHTEECYTIERVLSCEREELNVHVHDAGCFHTEEISVDEPEETAASEQAVSAVPEMPVSDPNADLETVDDWNREFENFELSGNWARDLILVAATQQGRGESQNNFEAILNDAGDAWVRHGYTRYGAWYGYPYAEWDAMFVSFCLRYAGIPAENVPNNPTAAFTAESFSMGELFAGRDYVPAAGDLIFFDTVDDEITNIDHMGIVYHVDAENGTINTVEGDRTDVVATFGYYLNDEQIIGYGILPQNPNYIPVEGEIEEEIENEFGGFIFMTTDEEEETPAAEEATAPAVPMPAQSWERTAGGIKVTVDAPEGAFPENTKIAVTPVNGNSLKDTVSDAVSGEVLEVQAVDITFFDADGREIEPAVPIRVVMTPAATENAEEKTSVVHVDIAQQTAELVEQAVGTEFDNSEVVFDADAFTIYAIVYTYQVEYEYEVDGKTFTSSMPGAENMSLTKIVEGLGIVDEAEIETFVSKIASIASSNEEVAVVNENNEIRVLKDGEAKIVITMQDGAKFHIDVRAEGETSASNETATVSTVGELYLPGDAELEAKVLPEEQSESAIAAVQAAEETAESTVAAETAYQVFDISLENVEAKDYEEGFRVELNLPENLLGRDFRLYHVHDNQVDELQLDKDAIEQADGSELVFSVSFVTPSFSEFVLSYTVDFTYGEYSCSIQGGTSILLSELVNDLHITDTDAAFMSRVENVEFTDPSLMRVTYVEYPTTVGVVEDSIFDIVFEDAEVEPRSNQELDAGEWLLTSLVPFKTEEALTITLDTGNQIVITVLDAQEAAGNSFITDAHLTIDGTTYGKDEVWNVYPDAGYTMKLSFAEKGQNQFPAGGDTIVVDLPQGLTIPEGEHHTFTIPAGLAGSITGNEYWVENGKIYVKFGEDPDDILTRSSNAHFDLTFTAKFEEGTTQIPFNDKVKPNIDMDTTADVSVSKSASYNSATGKMDYTITVRSTGNSEGVKVHDALSSTNLLKIDTGSITVSPGGTEYTVTASSQSGFDMTIPSIGHNQTVTITYSADVDTSALDHKGNIKVSEDGRNTVTVENDDDDHDDDTNTYTNQIKYSSTSKSSTSMEDHEEEQTATLGWKIVLNDNYRGSIVGDKVWDTIDWSSKDAMKYTVDENGNVTLHIAAKNQDGTKTYNTSVTAAVVTDANGVQSWEYTIPQLGDDPDEILSYEITYTTEVDKTKLDSGSNGIVKNNTTNEGDGSSTGTGVVPIPHSDDPGEDDIVGGKTAVNVTEEYVDWDIVINVPSEGFPEGLTVTDYVPMAPQYGGFADTFDSVLSVTGLVHDETYTVNCVSTDVDDNGNVIWNLRNYGRTRDVVTIEFYQDAQKTTKGLESGQARTVTIKIRTKNDPEWLAYVEREGSGDSNSFYHTNIAKANNTTFEGKAAPQRSKIFKTLIPGTEKADDGMPVYQYAVDLASVRSLPVVIEDTFNADELEYYAYWYETDNHQYIDGQSQRHMLNNGISPYKASIVAENGKITITATDLPKKDNGDFWEYYRIYYKLKIKNQAVLDSFTQKAIENGGVYYVRNTAVWNGTDDHVDIEFKVPTVEKTGAFRVNQGESGNDRLYDFAIDINENCLELNGGEPMDLTDTHTDNLTVDYTTVKVYKYVDGEKMLDTSIQWNFNGNIGTFYNLQDRTRYVIEYSCLVIGSAMQSFSNYAEMNGYHDEKHDSRDFGTSVDAGADVFQIGLIKFKNGMTSQGLAGATFQLFRGTGSFHEVTNGTDTWMEEDRIPMTWGVGTETAGKVGQNITFTTGEDGYVLIALDQTRHGAELEKGVHYFLKEIETPAGYQIDSSVEYWEFTLTMDPDEVCYGTKRDQYGNRLWIYFYYDDILKMNNTETDKPITVNVDKEWFDIEGNKIGNPNNLTAKVQLYQKKNNEDYVAVNTITNADGTIYNGKITLPANGSWEYSWEKLPRVDTDGNGYAYKLEEVEVPEDYVSSYTLNETENEKNYHLKNYRVTERKVNVSVSKTWLDEDGKTEIDINDLPEDLQEVQFYLYRVISRAPFTTAPTSGGNPYTIEGNQYLVTGPDAEDGLYKITREQFQAGISFEELPSVHKDDDGTWYFYSYYVKEVPVDGYSASVDVTETQDEQNNTILLSSMKNKKKPEERTTNFSVQKVWKDKEGVDKSWPDNTVVRFKLYQVTSTQPFDEQPTSGGVLYNVAQVNYNDHPNKISGEDGLYQMGHTYNGSVLYTAEFENLPEVTIDASGRATYYAYYVDEIEVTGYETSYGYVAEDGTVKVTITNHQEPEYTQLSVQKKWYDGETELTGDALTNLEASVELVRYRAEPQGATVHFYKFSDGHFVKMEGLDLLVKQNETINIHFDGISNGTNAFYGTDPTALSETETYKVNTKHDYQSMGYIQPQYGENASITIGDELDVYVVFYSDISISSTSTDQAATDSGSVTIDPDFAQFNYSPKQTALSTDNGFTFTFPKLLTSGKGSDGKTYFYTYGVREVSNPSGFAFESYSAGTNSDDTTDGIKASNPGTGTITVNNTKTEEPYGSLSITKNVSNANGNPSETVFTFEVELKNPDNTAYTGTVKVQDRTRTTATTVTADSGKIRVTVTGTGTATITEIPAETKYEVTEPSDHLPAGWSQVGEIIFGDTTKTIAANDSDTAKVTNTYEQTGDLEVSKIIQTNGKPDSSKTGTFSYAVYKAADVDESGSPKENVTAAATGQIVVGSDGTNPVTVSDLPYGTYYVYELGQDGTPIVSGESGALAVINGLAYTVIGSGTRVTVGAAAAGTESGDGTGAPAGNEVTLINELTDFEFTKIWKDALQNNADWPDNLEISVTVSRMIGSSEAAETVGTYTLKKTASSFTITKQPDQATTPDLSEKTDTEERNYTFRIQNLPKTGSIGDATGEYTYFVTEAALSGYHTSYSSPSPNGSTPSQYAFHEGTIINTPEGGIELPQTGGPGTALFTAIGGIMTATAGAVLTIRRRKQNQIA